jgi:hypothetical protein
MDVNYKKNLKNFGIYYLATFGSIGALIALGQFISADNAILNFIGNCNITVIALSGIWLTARLVKTTLEMNMESRLLKKLLFFVAYILAFVPVIFAIALFEKLFKSGIEYLLMGYLLLLPFLAYLTYRDVYKNYLVFRLNKTFPDINVQSKDLSAKHISQMLTLNKIDPSYDVLSMTSKEIIAALKEIDAEKRREAMKTLGTGLSLGFKALTYGMQLINKGSAGSSEHNISSSPYKSGLTMSAEGDVKRLEQDIERLRMYLREAQLGIRPDIEMYARMLAEAETELAHAKARVARNTFSDSFN